MNKLIENETIENLEKLNTNSNIQKKLFKRTNYNNSIYYDVTFLL